MGESAAGTSLQNSLCFVIDQELGYGQAIKQHVEIHANQVSSQRGEGQGRATNSRQQAEGNASRCRLGGENQTRPSGQKSSDSGDRSRERCHRDKNAEGRERWRSPVEKHSQSRTERHGFADANQNRRLDQHQGTRRFGGPSQSKPTRRQELNTKPGKGLWQICEPSSADPSLPQTL